jgi:hypothetical protein
MNKCFNCEQGYPMHPTKPGMHIRYGTNALSPCTATQEPLSGYVHTLSDVPVKACWVILAEQVIHVPGDERSRQAPGHGYPEHTDEYVVVSQFFLDEEIFKAELVRAVEREKDFSTRKVRGFKVTPYVTEMVVKVSVSEAKA